MSDRARTGRVAKSATEKTASKTAPTPPQGGAALPLGAHPGNTGGKKGRSGRRPSDVTKLAQDLADKHALLERLARFAAGEIQVAHGVDDEGVLITGPAKAADQINAARIVLAYAYGRPPEHVVVSGEVTRYVVTAPVFPATVDEWRRMFTPSRS